MVSSGQTVHFKFVGRALCVALIGIIALLQNRPSEAAIMGGAMPTDIVVSPSTLNGWVNYTTQGNGPSPSPDAINTFVSGPVSPAPPLGAGSLRHFTGAGTGAGMGGKTWTTNAVMNGVSLANIEKIEYKTLVDAASPTSAVATALNIYVDLDNSGTYSNAVDALLVFEGAYNGVSPTGHGKPGQSPNRVVCSGTFGITLPPIPPVERRPVART
jgi:hypothetical protein